MPKLDGFEVLELIDPAGRGDFRDGLRSIRHARLRRERGGLSVEAVQLGPVPQSHGRVTAAVARAARRQSARSARPDLSAAARARPSSVWRESSSRTAPRCTSFRSRSWIMSRRRTITSRCTARRRTISSSRPFRASKAQLDPKKFVRIHRSYIVNLERIARIEPYTKDSRVAVLIDGTQLPVSRSGHAKIEGAARRYGVNRLAERCFDPERSKLAIAYLSD